MGGVTARYEGTEDHAETILFVSDTRVERVVPIDVGSPEWLWLAQRRLVRAVVRGRRG